MTQTSKLILPAALVLLASTASSAQDTQRVERDTPAISAGQIETGSRFSRVTPNDRFLALAQARPGQTPVPRPQRPRRVDINWDEVAADRRRQNAQGTSTLAVGNFVQAIPRPSNEAAAEVANTRLPVLLPSLQSLQMPAEPVSLLFPREDFYTMSITGDGLVIEVFGTRLAHAEAPDALSARHLRNRDSDGLRITATEYGREVEFSRYGAAYSITIECGNPQSDPRCTSDNFARQVALSLLIVAGTPDGED